MWLIQELRRLDPKSVREHLKDGNYGGLYQRDDKEMMKIWLSQVWKRRAHYWLKLGTKTSQLINA